MAKSKNKQTFDELSPGNLSAFRRSQWFENAKLGIQIFLMIIGALVLTAFLILMVLVGVTQNLFPDTEGTRALSKLFTETTANAKNVALFAVGFFFREYLASKNIKS